MAKDEYIAQAFIKHAEMLLKESLCDELIEASEEATRLNPDDAMVYFHRSISYERKGDLNRAAADRKKATELDPKFQP